MSDNGRGSAVLDSKEVAVAQTQQPQAAGSPVGVSIRHVSHFHAAGQPQQLAPQSITPQPQGVVVSRRLYRGAIAAAAVMIAAAGILIGLLASWALYPQRTELVPIPMGVSERQAQDVLWRHAFAEAAVQTGRALREAPGSPDAIRASDSLELALTHQDADPWRAVMAAAHSAKTAEAALVQQAVNGP